MRLRLRTRLIIATLAISFATSVLCLLLVRHSVASELNRQRSEALAASTAAFGRVEGKQQQDLIRLAALVSELPTLKALMTSRDAATIQDASNPFWRSSGTDLLLLAMPDGRVMGEHAAGSTLSADAAQRLLLTSFARREQSAWWQDNNNLFRVAIQPIVAGAGRERDLLGFLVVGQHINTAFAQELASSSGAQIALASGHLIVASTLLGDELQEFTKNVSVPRAAPRDLWLGGRHFDVSITKLESGSNVPLRCYMLLPLDSTDAYLHRLNRTILFIGLLACALGAVIVSLISRALTRPLESLVGAVRAFAAGDDSYSIKPGGGVEAVELAGAFTRMRRDLTISRKRQLESERLAALGRAAGFISHDLRHHLGAVIANAEFLHDPEEVGTDRDEIYQEVLQASSRMTELLDALLEIAQEEKTLTVSDADFRDIVGQAVSAVRANPQFHARLIEVQSAGETVGRFDAKKLERVFFNLLLNSCEATNENKGQIGVTITSSERTFECRVSDTGSGIPPEIRDVLFEPFVSAGKNNGTGLGLAIAAKIIHDHGGNIQVAETSPAGTTIVMTIPRNRTTAVEPSSASDQRAPAQSSPSADEVLP